MTDETVEFKRQMLMQQQAMEYADSQMGLLGMQQKAEMTAEGYSPEQAEMWSQTPTPEMSQDMAWSEQEAEMARRQHPIGQEDQMREQEMMAMQNQPPPEDPNEEKRHLREKEKMALTAKDEDSRFKRDKERMTLQDTIEQRKHKRTIEQMRMKAKEAGKKPPAKKTPPKGKR
jgi:hypothetical protein